MTNDTATVTDEFMAAGSDPDLRVCEECDQPYSTAEAYEDHGQYFWPPFNYNLGVSRYCLACWLMVRPNDVGEAPSEESSVPSTSSDDEAGRSL